MERFDSDSDGTISLDEFKAMMNELNGQSPEGRGNFWRGLSGRLRRALSKDSINCKLDAAFKLSDVDRVETMEESYARGGMKLLDSETSALTFAIHLTDGAVSGSNRNPLFITCSKPGHTDAWVEAFRIVMAWNCPTVDWGAGEGRGKEEPDIGLESFHSDWRCSTIDWGFDDESKEDAHTKHTKQRKHTAPSGRWQSTPIDWGS